MSQQTGQYVNISGYRFVKLYDTYVLQKHYQEFCSKIGLTGTVIFSDEGVNVGVAGTREVVTQFVNHLRADRRFAGMQFKESFSDVCPFDRMKIKLKKMLVPSSESIDPNKVTGARLDPAEFKKWLDENKDITVLDTRNTYEYHYGSFENAKHLNIATFRDFGDALAQLPEETKQKPVVMFCTGGIRCEKATPIAMEAGFKEVYQLEGGILKYFEDCGGEHWRGDCFVFDDRVAVDPNLAQTPA